MSKQLPLDETDLVWMQHALSLAGRAEEQGEVPIGAVIVRDGSLVGEGWNRNIVLNDPTAHAEIIALRDCADRMGNYRLPGCVMYVTLEPCAMCVGAMIHARVERLVFGAGDPKTGAVGGRFNLLTCTEHNHVPAVSGGCLDTECGDILRNFFAARRVAGSASGTSRRD